MNFFYKSITLGEIDRYLAGYNEPTELYVQYLKTVRTFSLPALPHLTWSIPPCTYIRGPFQSNGDAFCRILITPCVSSAIVRLMNYLM